MRKIMILCYMVLLSSVFIFPQTGIKYDREMYLAEIFKVHEFKEKYEIVDYIYKHKERVFFKHHLYQNDSFLNRSFKLIKGFPYYELLPDSMPIEVPGRVEHISKEDINKYLEQLNYTPDKALKDYKDFIQLIQLEKEDYMNCIDSELAKGEASEYAKDKIYNYDFRPPGSSLLPFQTEIITKLNFLKIFKEFILIKEEEVLPIFI